MRTLLYCMTLGQTLECLQQLGIYRYTYGINMTCYYGSTQAPEKTFANEVLMRRCLKGVGAHQPSKVAPMVAILDSATSNRRGSSQAGTDDPGIGVGATATHHFFYKGSQATRVQQSILRSVLEGRQAGKQTS